MKKYLLIVLGILGISLFLITSELKAATFISLDTVAAEDNDKDGGCDGRNPWG